MTWIRNNYRTITRDHELITRLINLDIIHCRQINNFFTDLICCTSSTCREYPWGYQLSNRWPPSSGSTLEVNMLTVYWVWSSQYHSLNLGRYHSMLSAGNISHFLTFKINKHVFKYYHSLSKICFEELRVKWFLLLYRFRVLGSSV